MYDGLHIYVAADPPDNIKATVTTPRNVEVTWDQSSSSAATGYLISYTTTASYTSGRSVMVTGRSTTSSALTNLEENTLYTITIQATNGDVMSGNSNEVSVTTLTNGT